MPNQSVTISDTRIIELTNGMQCFVDADLYPGLSKFVWRAVKQRKCWYAKTTIGKTPNKHVVSMARLIAKTPRGQVPHHKNRHSLDNRRRNLVNCTRPQHTRIHREDTILIQRDPNIEPEEWI